MTYDPLRDWTAKIAEALLVHHRIPCRRKFSDEELQRPLEQVKRELGLLPPKMPGAYGKLP